MHNLILSLLDMGTSPEAEMVAGRAPENSVSDIRREKKQFAMREYWFTSQSCSVAPWSG